MKFRKVPRHGEGRGSSPIAPAILRKVQRSINGIFILVKAEAKIILNFQVSVE